MRGDVQCNPGPLPAIERIGIGGGDTVRGYRQNELAFDNGWMVSAGLEIPVGRLALPGLVKNLNHGRRTIEPFVDAGGGWNVDAPDGDITELLSVGIRPGWTVCDRTSVQIDFGLPILDTDSPENEDLQGYGLHFRLSTELSGSWRGHLMDFWQLSKNALGNATVCGLLSGGFGYFSY